jgi:hypothetical protein
MEVPLQIENTYLINGFLRNCIISLRYDSFTVYCKASSYGGRIIFRIILDPKPDPIISDPVRVGVTQRIGIRDRMTSS